MRRRTRTTLLIAAIVIALLGALAWLRQKAPPEVARLLPESDGIVYINFEPLRAAMQFDQHPVQHDAGYQRFIDATGFVFERDLHQAAISMHHMQNPHGPNGPVAYSEVFAGRFDHKRLTMIYAGAQKNLGPVGISVVIVRRSLLEREGQPRADILDYRSHLKGESMLNTPPSWNWYLLGLTVKWMLAEGGVEEFARRNARKSALLYTTIDGSGGFYRNEVDPAVRSRMNVPFFLHDDALDKPFLAEAKAAGLISLKGHRALGGMRASIYNAMPEAGVAALAGFMREFQQRHG